MTITSYQFGGDTSTVAALAAAAQLIATDLTFTERVILVIEATASGTLLRLHGGTEHEAGMLVERLGLRRVDGNGHTWTSTGRRDARLRLEVTS